MSTQETEGNGSIRDRIDGYRHRRAAAVGVGSVVAVAAIVTVGYIGIHQHDRDITNRSTTVGEEIGETSAFLRTEFRGPLPFTVVQHGNKERVIPDDKKLRHYIFNVINPGQPDAAVVAHDTIHLSGSDLGRSGSTVCAEQTTPMVTAQAWDVEAARLTKPFVPPENCVDQLAEPTRS